MDCCWIALAAEASAICRVTLMLFTIGGEFCGRYARVTLSRMGVTPPAPDKSGFHWMERALGLAILEAAGSCSGSDQSLQVLSGLAELPERVRKTNAVDGAVSARQLMLPQRAAVPASCTGDS